MSYRDPKTKEDIINRLTSTDFSGDLRDLAKDRNMQMQRIKRHVLRLKFIDSGREFDLTIHKPRGERAPKRVPEVIKKTARKVHPLDLARRKGRRAVMHATG